MASIGLYDEEQRESGVRDLLLFIVGLVVGAAALFAVAGPPRPPAELPTWDVIAATLRGSYLPPEVIAYALTTAAWGVWLWMVGTLLLRVVVVVADSLTHGAAWVHALRAVSDRVTLPIVRKVVDGALVALLVVNLIGRSPAIAAAAPPEPAGIALAVTPHRLAESTATSVGPIAHAQEREEKETLAYTVQAGDSLWAIAERFFGAGDRWPELFAANKDRPQPDGRRLVDERRIHAGWVLRVPVPNPAVRAEDGALHYVVRSGDSLSGIAARLLADQTRWPEIYELNRDVARLPDGRVLADPDLIWPELRLRLPLPAEVGEARPTPAPEPMAQAPSAPAVPIPVTPPEPTPEPATPTPIATVVAPAEVATEPESEVAGVMAEAQPVARDATSSPFAVGTAEALGAAGALAVAAGSAIYFMRRPVRRSLSEPPMPMPEPGPPPGDDFAESDLARALAHRLHGGDVEPAVVVAAAARRYLDEQAMPDAEVVAVYQARTSVTLLLDAPPLDEPRLLEIAASFAARLGGTGESTVTTGRDVVWRVTGLKAAGLLPPPADSGALPPLIALGLAAADETLFVDWDALAHVLAAGLPGGGTDVVLTSVVASLAARFRPDELRLWTVAGPQALPAELARLPHQARAFVDPDDEPGVEDVLRTLRAEVERRLRDAAESKVRRWRPSADQPMHVLVVSELAALSDDGTTFELLGNQGPSVGVRLLAATTRALTLGQDVLGHLETRLALQTQDDAESTHLLGRPDAVDLGPGELLVRIDGRAPVPLRGFRVREEHLGELARVMRDAYPRPSFDPPPAADGHGSTEVRAPKADDEPVAATELDASPSGLAAAPCDAAEVAHPTPTIAEQSTHTVEAVGQQPLPLVGAASGNGHVTVGSNGNPTLAGDPPVGADGETEAADDSAMGRDGAEVLDAISVLLPDGGAHAQSLNGHTPVGNLDDTDGDGADDDADEPDALLVGEVGAGVASGEGALITIRCLGGFEVRSGDRVLKPIGEEGASYKAWEVLAFLAAQPGGVAPKEKLLGAIWPEVNEERGANRLRMCLVRLRGILVRQVPRLTPKVVRVQRSGTCGLDANLVWSDAHRFSELCAAAHTLPPAEARRALEEALTLYRGPLLSSRSTRLYDWIEEEDDTGVSPRKRYHRLYSWAVHRMGDLYRREGRTDRAIELYRHVLESQPTLEDIVRELFRCYAELGDLSALVGEERHLREALRKAHGSSKAAGDDPDWYPPQPETIELFNRLRAELEARVAMPERPGAETAGALAER